MKQGICVIMLLLFVGLICLGMWGCHGNNAAGGGGEAIALGTNHIITGGEEWNYNVSGTLQPADGPAQTFGPVPAKISIGDEVVPLQTPPNAWVYAVEADFTVGDREESFRHAVAVRQGVGGVMTVVGFTPHLEGVPGRLDDPIPGLDLIGFQTMPEWSGISNVQDGWGQFEADATFTGLETVNTEADSFRTVKVEGEYSLAGFPVTLVTWFNPQVGCFVRMTEHWEEWDGATMDLVFELTSTNVEYE